MSELKQRARMHAALGEPLRLAIVDRLVLGDAAPGELSARFGLATNLLAFHLGVLDQAGIVRRVRSEGDRRRQYVQLRLDDPLVAGLTPSGADTSRRPPAAQVVFVCTANSARSQLAAAAWRRVSHIPVTSAGTRPAPRIHPRAVRVGRRHGLDLAKAPTRRLADVHLDPGGAGGAPLLVAVCDSAHEHLVSERSADRATGDWLHWHVPDPVPVDTDAAFEAAYREITQRVERLSAALAPQGAAS
jgi:protein-tyrosine-phosphatase